MFVANVEDVWISGLKMQDYFTGTCERYIRTSWRLWSNGFVSLSWYPALCNQKWCRQD